MTKTSSARHASGLLRVTRRLQQEFGPEVQPVVWSKWNRQTTPSDWFLTAELFNESERPGATRFLEERRCRVAAIFHDAIPLRYPHITWPQSVARHPAYLKLLARLDHVFAVSQASAADLSGFWRWQGATVRAEVSTITLGSDFDGSSRRAREESAVSPAPRLLCVGIVEPRKNQTFLLDVAERLWAEGCDFELDVVGRVNPHFGAPIEKRLVELARREPRCHWHESLDDEALARLYATARAVVFPTIAEGCGLPLLEGLWRGLPIVASDLPVLRENAADGGCLLLPVNDQTAWAENLRRILQDDTLWRDFVTAACSRPLPTWRYCADQILRKLRGAAT
ncbi:MAG TPA: glycosyltransferase [Candidatus Synoicihabitans sp.]|nr:glycosyltransferase [Candidatus Synoicihabitans sp.]